MLEAFQNEVGAYCLSNGRDKQRRCLTWMECFLAQGADQGHVHIFSVFVLVIRLSCCGEDTKKIVCRAVETSGQDFTLHYRSLLSDLRKLLFRSVWKTAGNSANNCIRKPETAIPVARVSCTYRAEQRTQMDTGFSPFGSDEESPLSDPCLYSLCDQYSVHCLIFQTITFSEILHELEK